MSKCFPLNKWHAVQSVLVDNGLGRAEKLTYARLAYYHNTKTHACFPSVSRLATDLGCTSRTIRSSLRKLEKAGHIGTKPRSGRNGTNMYDLKIEPGKNLSAGSEKAGTFVRKPGSDKQVKIKYEPNRYGHESKATPKVVSRESPKAKTENAKDKQHLQNALVEKLGGGERGWTILLGADQETLKAIEDAWMKEKISLEQAVTQSLQMISQNEIN